MLSQKRSPLLGVSPAFKDISQKIRSVADTETTVLVSGETGTGKELVARAIHDLSSRSPGPFIPIDCAGIPENLFDGELFGHRRGAFTGAQNNRAGKLMGANGGTLFLDAIDSLSLNNQTSLLRVIQEKEILPLGQTRPRSISFRLVTSVSHEFSRHIDEGKFRKDLYFRINVVHLCLPPLRQRKEDIAILTKYFLKNTSIRFGKKVSRIESKALHILEEYNWPGES